MIYDVLMIHYVLMNDCCRGGVIPPGAAFAKTSLLTRLVDNGLKVEVVKEELNVAPVKIKSHM